MKIYVTSFINKIVLLGEDLLSFFYPIYCASCGKRLMKEFEVLCLTCETSITKTNYHLHKENPLEKKFWGRCNIEKATAFYFFEKKGQVQNMLFHLKYKGNQALGRHLGKLMAQEINNSIFCDANVIVPVPLHPKKQIMRGYNQIHSFCEGFSELLDIPLNTKNLIRITDNSTQTKKNRLERWTNVEHIFKVKNMSLFQNQDVILVDDVVTTGATIEACCEALQEAGVRKIYLVSLAVAI